MIFQNTPILDLSVQLSSSIFDILRLARLHWFQVYKIPARPISCTISRRRRYSLSWSIWSTMAHVTTPSLRLGGLSGSKVRKLQTSYISGWVVVSNSFSRRCKHKDVPLGVQQKLWARKNNLGKSETFSEALPKIWTLSRSLVRSICDLYTCTKKAHLFSRWLIIFSALLKPSAWGIWACINATPLLHRLSYSLYSGRRPRSLCSRGWRVWRTASEICRPCQTHRTARLKDWSVSPLPWSLTSSDKVRNRRQFRIVAVKLHHFFNKRCVLAYPFWPDASHSLPDALFQCMIHSYHD